MTIAMRTETVPTAVDRDSTALLDRLRELNTQDPVQVIWSQRIMESTAAFSRGFPGRVLFAMKANPHPLVLSAVSKAGIIDFDVASLRELELLRTSVPNARPHFMNPVKAREEIQRACFDGGVRSFALDCDEELRKILEETAGADDLGLFVRVRVNQQRTVHRMGAKFGADLPLAVALLRKARPYCARLGVTFHVGSQCMDPAQFGRALMLIGRLIERSGVVPDIVDIGGGFPTKYANLDPPPMEHYIADIRTGWEMLGLPTSCELWAEPGRALCATGSSVVLRVLLRRGLDLFLNDGVYGALSHCTSSAFRYPVKLIGLSDRALKPQASFTLYGPTCDSADRLIGRYLLPLDVVEGDYIEFCHLGAYGCSLASSFNGYGQHYTLGFD